MRVHIVCIEHRSDQILARLIRHLLEIPGYTAGKRPDPKADINYFFPYLLRNDFIAFNATPTAAWFTHRDTAHSQRKADKWIQAARTVDLRLTVAQMYHDDLSQYGTTELTVPPVELDKFVPIDRPKNSIPVVGVSGHVYKGGRKGEELVKRLAASELGKRIKLVASGKGWPVPTRNYAWKDMQKFYQSLDVYLCTASIEGIPMPPLEALACRIPVLVPLDVGLLNDVLLPHPASRYETGNYEHMEKELTNVLKDWECNSIATIDDYRMVIDRFTPDAWRQSNINAFERMLYPPVETYVKPEPVTERTKQGTRGVYIVAYGKPARDCAKTALKSWKTFMPDVQTALVSDSPLGIEDVFIDEFDADIGARSVKTRIYDVSPQEWETVVYVDADTELINPVPFLFELIEAGWDMFICMNPARYGLIKDGVRPDNHEEMEVTFKELGGDEFLQLNAGVLGFRRNERTATLFRVWHNEWQRYGARDQAALARALHANPIKLYVLGQEWNTILREDKQGRQVYNDPKRSAGIVHYPLGARRWKGLIDGRLDTTEAWAAVHPKEKMK